MCLRQAQAPRVAINITPVIERSRNHRDENKNVPSTGSGTESNTVIERSRNHRMRNKNVPSTGSGSESNTLIERSRNHRDENKNVPSTMLRHRFSDRGWKHNTGD